MSIPSHPRPRVAERDADEPEWSFEDFERASLEVDQPLLRWSLSLSIRERLRVATRTARMLGRFHRVVQRDDAE